MINNVYGGGEFLSVQTYTNTPYIDNTSPSAGQVRFNPTNRNMEVSDGYNWITLSSSAEVKFTPDADEVLRWAREKMQQEQNWRDMAEKNPAIRDAYEKFKQAEEQLRIVEALVQK